MCNRPRVTTLKLIVDNSQDENRKEYLLARAVQAYWRTQRKDAALEFLTPLPTLTPRGLAQKVEILQDMVETQRSVEAIAGLAASIAGDALSMSRNYLNRVD